MTSENTGEDKRPKPAYGEYAPEGWEWKPEGTESAEEVSTPASAGSSAPTTPASGTVPGVPHNLGAGSALPPRSAAATPQQPGVTQSGSGAPYRAEGAPQAAPAATPNSAVKPPRPADRVVTILLLVAGLFGALQAGLAMISLGSTFKLIGSAPGLEDFTAQAWLDPTGKVLGIALLAFYGIVLVYSIRRLRAGKLTFWVPLAAGVIVAVFVIAVVMIAIITNADLMNVIGNPEKSTALIEYLQGRTTL